MTDRGTFRSASCARRQRRQIRVVVVLVFVGALACAELLRQKPPIRYGRWGCGAGLAISTGPGDDPTDKPKGTSFIGRPVFHGPFVVAEYRIERHVKRGEYYYQEPAMIEGGSTVEFLPHVPYEITEIASRYGGVVPYDRTHFIGQVSIRREILWTLVAATSVAGIWTGTNLAATTRRIRRFKKWRCTRCAYPLPLEDEQPRCPECGMLHTP